MNLANDFDRIPGLISHKTLFKPKTACLSIYPSVNLRELHEWMSGHLSRHPLFEAVPEAEAAEDPVVGKLFESTEEGQKVSRNSGTNCIKEVFPET